MENGVKRNMSFTQLNPQIPLMTSKGQGQAIGVIDYSAEHDLMWVVILDTHGEIWVLKNALVRGLVNYSIGRTMTKDEEWTE
jgi:hypothetical protein